ncbi:hypothetical protein DEU34_1342 [Microbacterium sp. AG1240]|uniref:hypothetical protein n=1 Tax=Microbacterium sp. AG1240 TaxID=2183992 RepID=UPI000F261877|nr:hypothetical protein [Microbacterium sp. AG1240]RKT36815.1 hypothetical protein DEU34_1342 [Microbacterium sp. AG1240]
MTNYNDNSPEHFHQMMLPAAARIRGIDHFVKHGGTDRPSPVPGTPADEILYALIAVGADFAKDHSADLDFLQEMLPPVYSGRYTESFQGEFRTALAEVTKRLEQRWEGPRCIAHELALAIILEYALGVAGSWEIPLGEEFFDDLFVYLVGNGDYKQLYFGTLAAVEGGIYDTPRNYRFDLWFVPYN